MKKGLTISILAALTALVVALAGCTGDASTSSPSGETPAAGETTPQTVETQPAGNPAPQLTAPFAPSPSGETTPQAVETQPAGNPTPQLTAPSAPASPGGVRLPNGPLPDGEYSPLKPPERYNPEPASEFIPSDGYGRIWPYVGGVVDSMMSTPGVLIGICDGGGKIICDPVYNDVKLISGGGRELYAFIKYDILPGDQYENLYITTLAATDGSWAEAFDSVIWEESTNNEYPTADNDYYSYQWRGKVSYDYITAKRGGKWGVLDWDGSVLLPFQYVEPVCFHEGLAAVLSDDGETYSFIDITGKTVLGPYEAPPRPVDEWNFSGVPLSITDKIIFYEGYAKYYENGKYGIIGRDGRVVVPAKYDYITSMNGGIAMFVVYYDEVGPGQAGNKRFGVVNDSGAVIVGPKDYNYTYYGAPFYADGHAVVSTYGGKGDVVAYDGTKTPYKAPDTWSSISGNTVEFKDRDLVFTGYSSVTVLDDGRFVAYSSDRGIWRLFDSEGAPISPERPGVPSMWLYSGLQYNLLFIDVYGARNYYPPFTVYDKDGNQYLKGEYYAFIPIGDKYLVRGKTTAGLMNKDGSYVIEVSIAAYNVD